MWHFSGDVSNFKPLPKQPNWSLDAVINSCYGCHFWLKMFGKFCAPTRPGTPRIFSIFQPIPSRLKDGIEVRPQLMWKKGVIVSFTSFRHVSGCILFPHVRLCMFFWQWLFVWRISEKQILRCAKRNSGNSETNYVLRTVAAQAPCAYVVISNVHFSR